MSAGFSKQVSGLHKNDKLKMSIDSTYDTNELHKNKYLNLEKKNTIQKAVKENRKDSLTY